jgi:hypothetical protein
MNPLPSLSDEQIDALDTFALHCLAPQGRESVREFARAVLASRAAAPQAESVRIALNELERAAVHHHSNKVDGLGVVSHQRLIDARQAVFAALAGQASTQAPATFPKDPE